MCISVSITPMPQHHNEALKMFPKVLSWKDLCKALEAVLTEYEYLR